MGLIGPSQLLPLRCGSLGPLSTEGTLLQASKAALVDRNS
jgi:hypothetical protein